MVIDLVTLGFGVAAAAVGGELFVRGVVGLSSILRVPAALVAATMAAFATSTPELSVGLHAASSGDPALALGDALGSNVANVALVLGVVLLMGPLDAKRRELRRDLSMAAIAPLLTLVALIDGRIVRAEALVLLAVFFAWIVAVGRVAIGERGPAAVESEDVVDELAGGDQTELGVRRVVVVAVLGLGFLVLAGRLIVTAAEGIGHGLGLDAFVVGATMVALGTSTPELATAVIARWRGHGEVGVGTVLGSNVFNNLWIVGVVAMVEPIETAASDVLLAVVACLLALALVVPRSDDVVPRQRGALLLLLGTAYVVATVYIGQ